MEDKKELTKETIKLDKVLADKGIKAPRWVVKLLNRFLHVDEINSVLYNNRDKEGVDFAVATMEYLGINVEVVNPGRIPVDGNPIVVANHPLGGPDGIALIAAVGKVRSDVKFPVNDFLMHVTPLKQIFVPIDKVHGNRNTAAGINEAFASNNILLYFPAGLCSRRIKGKIVDLEWKPTVIKKAIEHHRDIIPVSIEARNRRRFYTIANLRKRLGIKFNFEMALLPAEMFAQKGKTFRMTVGEPIPWQQFADGKPARVWAEELRQQIYRQSTNQITKQTHRQ